MTIFFKRSILLASVILLSQSVCPFFMIISSWSSLAPVPLSNSKRLIFHRALPSPTALLSAVFFLGSLTHVHGFKQPLNVITPRFMSLVLTQALEEFI